MTDHLDFVDKRIIYHLTNDARNTSAPMIADEVNVSSGKSLARRGRHLPAADEVNVSSGTIRNRIGQLEESGIIIGYHAAIDYERVERRLTNLFVCHVPVSERESIAKRVLDIPVELLQPASCYSAFDGGYIRSVVRFNHHIRLVPRRNGERTYDRNYM